MATIDAQFRQSTSGGGSAPGLSVGGSGAAPGTSGIQGAITAGGVLGLGAIKEAADAVNQFAESSQQFTDVETLAAPFTEAFDKFSSTAEEVFMQEARQAEDDLAAFVNNSPDIRGAVNLTVARQIKGDIYNATLQSAAAVQNQLSQGIFAASQLASTNFANISSTVSQAATSLASSTASFVASLTGQQASIYSAELNFGAQMAQIDASRDIASIQADTTRRGQDIQFDIASMDDAFRQQTFDFEAEQAKAAESLRTPNPIQVPQASPESLSRPPAPTRFTNSTINPVQTIDFNRIP